MLPLSRNILHESFIASERDYCILQTALHKNASWSKKTGPSNAFHNHNAAWLICAYRMGATPEELLAITSDESNRRKKLQPSSPLVITEENWEVHLGMLRGVEVGLYGLGAETNFAAYEDFFHQQGLAHGVPYVLQRYLPRLSCGLAGDFFHAVIELGCYFESRESSLLYQGLAWLAASYVELPGGPLAGKMETLSPTEALAQLSAKESFPEFELDDGSSGYIDDLELLARDFRDEITQYDLLTAHRTEAELEEFMAEVLVAARDSYAAGGCTDFYTLHSVTGSRAVWAIFHGLGQGGAEWVVEVKRNAISALWRALIFTHVARGNPRVDRSGRYALEGCEAERISWAQINAWALHTKNEHVIKVIFSLGDFYDRSGDVELWTLADRVLRTWEGQETQGYEAAGADPKLGGANVDGLVGTGVGGRLHKFVARMNPGLSSAL